MPASGDDLEILGVTIARSGPVQDLVHLALGGRLTVLYGLNGSGKTSLLRCVELALSGVNPDEDLEEEDQDRRNLNVLDVHVRVRDGDRLPRAISEAISAATRRHGLAELLVEDEAGTALGRLAELMALDLRRDLLDRASRCAPCPRVDEHHSAIEERTRRWGAALREAAAAGRLTFRAHGTARRPAWMMYLAASTDHAAGRDALAGHLQLLRDRSGPMPGDPDWHDQQFDPRRCPSLDSESYWSSPRYVTPRAFHAPQSAIQVPVVRIGPVGAWSAHEMTALLGDGRPRRRPGGVDGLRLAKVVGLEAGDVEPDDATMGYLIDRTGNHAEGLLGEDGSVSEETTAEVGAVQAAVNEIFQGVMPGGPRLTFRWGDPETWLRGLPPAWFAGSLHLSLASAAQQRWARTSITLVLEARRNWAVDHGDPTPEQPDTPLVLLCDEPESGLHRVLEHNLARGVDASLRRLGGHGVLATHSPSLLSSPRVDPVLVSATDGRGTRVRPVTLSVASNEATTHTAQSLGLAVGDVWALSRLTVLVEGVHDEWVFADLLQDDLESAIAGLVSMHGATRLRSLAEAQVLVRGTDAPLLVVLDELDADSATQHLDEVKVAIAAGDESLRDAALERLRAAGKKKESLLFVHQLAHAAVPVEGLGRLFVHGLSLPDVICYLPEDLLFGPGHHWDDLIARWRAEAGHNRATNIKGWLKRKGLLPQDSAEVDAVIREASFKARREARPVHPDLVDLGMRLVGLSNDAPGGDAAW